MYILYPNMAILLRTIMINPSFQSNLNMNASNLRFCGVSTISGMLGQSHTPLFHSCSSCILDAPVTPPDPANLAIWSSKTQIYWACQRQSFSLSVKSNFNLWNTSFWVNWNSSLTWIYAILGWFLYKNHDYSEGEQWGRYNLPRSLILGYCWSVLQKMGHYPKQWPLDILNRLVVYLPLWKMMDFVSWDDELPKIWKVIQNSMVPVTTNQLIRYT